jgi:HK97 family phage portal protein
MGKALSCYKNVLTSKPPHDKIAIMGIFDRFLSRKSSVTGVTLTPQGLYDYITSGVTSSHGLTVTPEVAIKSATVYSCCKIISEDVAKLPIGLYRKTGEKRDPIINNRLSMLVKRMPNPRMTALEFFESIVWDLALTGNAYAYVSLAQNKPYNLYPIPIEHVQIQIDTKTGDPIYSVLGEVVPRRKIVHFRDQVGADHYGRSRLKAQAEAIGLDVLAERLTGKLIKNGFRMTPVLSHPKALSVEARKKLKTELKEHTQGEDPFLAMLLEEGMEWKPAQMTPDDAQLLQLRQLQRSLVLSVFRMPPHKVGDLSSATHNNVELKEQEYYSGTIGSWTTRIEQVLDRDLLTEAERAEGLYFKYNLNAMVKADMVARFNAYQIGLRNGIYNADEVRAMEDMNPREDGFGGLYYQSGDLHESGKEPTKDGNAI